MQKKLIIIYFSIFLVLIIMLSLSRHTNDRMRGQSVAVMAPLWKKILSFKFFLSQPSAPSPWNHLSLEERNQELLLENQLLEIEISYLQEQLHEQQYISSQLGQLAPLMPEEAKALALEYQDAVQSAFKVLKKRIHAVPGRVFFRSFDTWNSFLWINLGASLNENFDRPVVAVNSPVVIGKSIVGVIDYVGLHESRVRLITDYRLTPSVRALRGGEQDFLLSDQIERVLFQINNKKNLPISIEEKSNLSQLLGKLRCHLLPLKKTWHLAKGELRGTLFPTRLGQVTYLRGVGFNYDLPDEEGSARDLRNGKIVAHSNEEAIPILKVDDLLVTTGMDGIFPPGFQVATVTKVETLKEGDYFYDIEAQPLAGPLEELSLVFVLPPASLNFQESAK